MWCGRTASIDAARRYAAGLAEVGRAEDRHVGDRAGVVDQVADAHDLARDDRLGLQRRAAGGRSAGDLRQRRQREREAEQQQRRCHADHGCLPQRIRLEVAESIWSAAVITLAFIS